MRLRPVTFHYRDPYDDGSHLRQYGLVAEEVAEVLPGLVELDHEGRPLAVRYHFLNAMLLNEVQRQERTIAALREETAEQRRRLAEQEERLRRLEAALATNR